jgi:hypothetical protein
MKKYFSILMTVVFVLSGLLMIGCQGGAEEGGGKSVDEINKNLEGQPPAGDDPLGGPKKGG